MLQRPPRPWSKHVIKTSTTFAAARTRSSLPPPGVVFMTEETALPTNRLSHDFRAQILMGSDVFIGAT